MSFILTDHVMQTVYTNVVTGAANAFIAPKNKTKDISHNIAIT